MAGALQPLVRQTGTAHASIEEPAAYLVIAAWLPAASVPGLQVALQNSGTNALDLAQLLPKQWQAFLKG